jgi:L-asparaginase
MSSRPHIHFVATGGTIAMRIDPATGGAVPALTGAELTAAVPGLQLIGQIDVEEFANIPSEHMQPEFWLCLARRMQEILAQGGVDGIVVLHGTDIMEETAFFLDVTVPTEIPIVFTGAMRSASDAKADGPANILDAAAVAASPDARNRGVVIVMHGEIHSARRVTKIDTSAVDAFESIMPPDLGTVRSGLVEFSAAWSPHIHVPLPEQLPRVDIITMYAGVDDFALRAALERGATGLVIAGVGAGNVNQALYQGISEALAARIPVVISSRVPYGGAQPLYSYAGGGMALRRAGAIFARDLNPQKARVLLMVGLGAGYDQRGLEGLFV